MTYIKLISLNVCNDDDLIYGTGGISESDIKKFIIYHNIENKIIISDLEKLYNSKIKTIIDNRVVIGSDYGIDYLDSAIVSYYIYENELRSITINLGNKIRYINNLDPEIIDVFMTNKKHQLLNNIIESEADFICLQELNDHYLIAESDLSNYSIISPLTSIQDYSNISIGMMSNYLLYKKSDDIKFIQSYLKEFGTMGEFNVDGNIIKIVSGKWCPFKKNTNIRLRQLDLLDRENGKIIYMGDTNLRNNENIRTYHVFDGLIENKFNRSYTINKNINKYFNDDYNYVSRYDRIYMSNTDLKLINCELYFDTIHEELKNIYRNSGFISDHFGLLAEIMI